MSEWRHLFSEPFLHPFCYLIFKNLGLDNLHQCAQWVDVWSHVVANIAVYCVIKDRQALNAEHSLRIDRSIVQG